MNSRKLSLTELLSELLPIMREEHDAGDGHFSTDQINRVEAALAQQEQPCEMCGHVAGHTCRDCAPQQAQPEEPCLDHSLRIQRLVEANTLLKQAQPLTDENDRRAVYEGYNALEAMADIHRKNRDADERVVCTAFASHLRGMLARDRMAQQVQPECRCTGRALDSHIMHGTCPQPEMPTRGMIAEAIWRGGDHWSAHEWPLRKLQETEAWECYLRQADAVLALFAPKETADDATSNMKRNIIRLALAHLSESPNLPEMMKPMMAALLEEYQESRI